LVEFKKMEFKNFLSYGSASTSFSFEKGLHTIVGKNGRGKSSIIDALSFVLYGQPYRNIRIPELVNRINGKKCEVSLEFEVNGHSYKIMRGLKPTKFSLKKDDNELDLLSSKKLTQTEIDKIIGADYRLFRQVIALSLNASKPFLSLNPAEKRSIIDTIFNIDVFGEMTKNVKNDIAEKKVDLRIMGGNLNLAQHKVSNALDRLSEYERLSRNFDTDKRTKLESVTSKINNTISLMKENKEKWEVYSAKLTDEKFDESVQKGELSSLRDELSTNRYEISKRNEENVFLDENDVCIYCGNPITIKHRESHKKENGKIISRLEKRNQEIENRISVLEKEIESIQSKRAEQSELASNMKRLSEKNLELGDSLSEYKNSRKEIMESKFILDGDSIKNEYEQSKKSYEDEKSKYDNLSHEMIINEYLSKILSDDGVKSYFLNNLLPILNSKVSEYLKAFDMPFVFSFNSKMDEKIISVSGKQSEVTYQSLSEGEKKRIDIAIIFSFMDVIKTISNWDCNLLFIDELLDSAVDTDNSNLILNSMDEIVKKNKNLCFYVITHRFADSYNWNTVVNIEKHGCFSSLKVKKDFIQ